MVDARQVLTDPREVVAQSRRVRWALWLTWLGLVLLAVRLWQIQIVDGSEYRRLAALQSSRLHVLLPPRGLILDRNGELIVDNRPGLRLRLHPDRVTDAATTLAFLRTAMFGLPATVAERFETALRRRPFRPETLVEQLDRNVLARIVASGFEHPELEVQTAPLRRYVHGSLAAHLLGYLGEIDDDELAARSAWREYASGDIVGKMGVERSYDPWLFGTKGFERLRVDARGRSVELLERVPPRPGWDLKLTLDLKTQQVAEAALGARRGAVIAIDPTSGGVLASVSHPAFDPELFVGGIAHADWQALRNDPGHPLIYRPINGLYPPGSTIKPFVALGALASGAMALDETVYCPGYYRLGRRTFRCWKAGGHGRVDLRKAIVESCDVYFYEAGKRMGIEALAAYLRMFGFGRATGLELRGELDGLVPDPAWKQLVGRGAWQEGETIITAIGQGSMLATPLQLVRAYAALANGGTLLQPHVHYAFAATDRPSPVTAALPTPQHQVIQLDAEALAIVRDALVAVVNEPGGTGGWSRLRDVTVAGKTGTAQVVQQAERGKVDELAAHLRDHAWFVAYAPADAPRIVVAVIVENGGQGSAAAAPIARQVLQAYLEAK